MRKFKLLAQLLALLLACSTFRAGAAVPTYRLRPPTSAVPATLFGMHILHLVTGARVPTPWPSIPFAAWRLWDTHVTWSDLEPQKGKWDFANLDKYVALAQEHDVQILMPLGMPPPWASERPKEAPAFRPGSAAPPANMQDWDNYVRTLATRYKGRIHYWELWNEPNLKQFYTGTVPHMVAIAKATYIILKQVDPSNELVSPSATGGYTGPSWLDSFLKAGGGSYVDIIGFHFYVTPEAPEAMVPLIQEVKQVMEKDGAGGKPLWATEIGWFVQNKAGTVRAPSALWKVVSGTDATGYVARTYILAWASGISRLYWYGWDNGPMALTEEGGARKPAAYAYWITEKWLIGAQMTSCSSDSSDTWVCHVTRNGGYNGYIVWNPNRKINFAVPKDWGSRYLWQLYGATIPVPKNGIVTIWGRPTLLENRSQQ